MNEVELREGGRRGGRLIRRVACLHTFTAMVYTRADTQRLRVAFLIRVIDGLVCDKLGD